MRKLLLASAFVFGVAFAASANASPETPGAPVAQPQQPIEMVVMPRQLIEASIGWISQPDANVAVKLYEALAACLLSNPHNGVVNRNGPDHCTAVTDELNRKAASGGNTTALTEQLAEKDKTIKALTEQLAALKEEKAAKTSK